MKKLVAQRGNGTWEDYLLCPELFFNAETDEPDTATPEWQVLNSNLCTIINHQEFCMVVTSSLFGKGANAILTVVGITGNVLFSEFELTGDDWPAHLSQINIEIEALLRRLLEPHGWVLQSA